MIYELQKQQSQNMKQMEAELLKELVKNITIEKGVLEKIENKRYQRIKCHELMSFMEESNIDQKIKNSGHINIYHKYEQNILSFKDIFDKFSSQLIQSKSNANIHKPQQGIISQPPLTFNQNRLIPGGQHNNAVIERVQSPQEQNRLKVLEDKYRSL